MKISKKILLPFIVLIIAVISYGQTLLMTFYQDDAAVIFKLQHIEGQAGSYGAGPFGDGPYKYTITPFIPFYKFFEVNPFGYFFVGFLLFLLALPSLYLLAKELFGNKRVAYFSTLIFATGYIGSNSMLKISNSWQNNLGLILLLLLLWSLVSFFRKRRFKFYLLSLGLYLVSVQFIFIRSHSLIFSIFILEIILGISPVGHRKLLNMFIRQVPFWIIFYLFYLKGEVAGASSLGGILESLKQGRIEVLSTFFSTFGNVFVPKVFQERLLIIFSTHVQLLSLLSFSILTWIFLSFIGAKRFIRVSTLLMLCICFIVNQYFSSLNLYWYRDTDVRLSGALGMYVLIFLLSSSFTLWSKYKSLALGIFFGLLFTLSQIFSYFIKYPEATFTTTHRYLYYNSIGFGLVLGILTFLVYFLLKEQKFLKKYTFIPLIPLILIVMVNSLLSYKYQRYFVIETSIPTQQFYQSLKKDIPVFKKGSVFYFDVANNSKSQAQFADFFSVGSMPNTTAIAIYYNVDRYDLAMVTDFNELLFKLSKGEVKIDDTYSFYFGPDGLINTTIGLRKILREGSGKTTLRIKQNSPTSVSLTESQSLPVSPLLLTVRAKVLPQDTSYLSDKENFNIQEKEKIISYLLARQDYYKTVNVSSLSEWKYQETPSVIDDNLDTSWRGHRIYWHDNRQEQLTVDLGQVKNVNRVVWVNWVHTLTPTAYSLLASLDGQNWKVLKQIKGGEKKANEIVEDRFDPTEARFIKMDITATLSNDAPAISEFEVVNTSFSEVDIHQSLEYIGNPFSHIGNSNEAELVFSKAAPLLNLKSEIETNKGKVVTEVPIGQFGSDGIYQFIFNGGGTNIRNIIISTLDMPVRLEVESAELSNLNLREIEEKGLIKKFVSN